MPSCNQRRQRAGGRLSRRTSFQIKPGRPSGHSPAVECQHPRFRQRSNSQPPGHWRPVKVRITNCPWSSIVEGCVLRANRLIDAKRELRAFKAPMRRKLTSIPNNSEIHRSLRHGRQMDRLIKYTVYCTLSTETAFLAMLKWQVWYLRAKKLTLTEPHGTCPVARPAVRLCDDMPMPRLRCIKSPSLRLTMPRAYTNFEYFVNRMSQVLLQSHSLYRRSLCLAETHAINNWVTHYILNALPLGRGTRNMRGYRLRTQHI